MYKKALFIPIIALTLLSLAPSIYQPVQAVSASPSPEPANISEVTENLKKRLQESLENSDAKPSTSFRAYIGIVKDVIKDTLIIEDKDGKKDIKILEGTTIIRSPGNASIKSDNIRIDDYIIAIGNLTEDEILDGKRLIVSVNPFKIPLKQSGMGTITEISKSEITLRVAEKDVDISITSKTIVKTPTGAIEISDLSTGDTIIYTANLDKDEDLTATILMRINEAQSSQE